MTAGRQKTFPPSIFPISLPRWQHLKPSLDVNSSAFVLFCFYFQLFLLFFFSIFFGLEACLGYSLHSRVLSFKENFRYITTYIADKLTLLGLGPLLITSWFCMLLPNTLLAIFLLILIAVESMWIEYAGVHRVSYMPYLGRQWDNLTIWYQAR